MRKIKAATYGIMGFFLVSMAHHQGNYALMIGVAVMVIAMIALTLSPIGRTVITWDPKGITIRRFPSKAVFIPWTGIKQLKVDHVEYMIEAEPKNFNVQRANMPPPLLAKIKASIAERNKDAPAGSEN